MFVKIARTFLKIVIALCIIFHLFNIHILFPFDVKITIV